MQIAEAWIVFRQWVMRCIEGHWPILFDFISNSLKNSYLLISDKYCCSVVYKVKAILASFGS